jgi:hypothetical protein
MTDQALKTIIKLTDAVAFYKSEFARVTRLNNARNKRQKIKLEQLEEKAYEWDFKD